MAEYNGKTYLGLHILGILTLISGIGMILLGGAYAFLGAAMEEASQDSIIGIIALFPVAIAVYVMAAVMIVVGVILIIFGYKLFVHSKTAYWLFFILTIIGIVSSLIYMQIFSLIIGIIVAYYLYTIRGAFMDDNYDYKIKEI